ncbi:MAG TPA: hypothetical protein VKU01_33465 [Bryobacteraceae bacterium]|nr:hypothetical protein [Bryobacteraceae bacterium]
MRTFAAAMMIWGIALLPASVRAANLPDPNETQIQDIISKFAAKEADFARARGNYTYRQTARIIELDDNGNPGGRWEIVSDIVFTPDGKRTEHVVRSPVPSLQHILLTPQDEQDLREVQPFVLTTNEIPMYYIRYLGREKLDEITCYAFAVKPKKMESGKRYFEGIVWVDDKDLQIVKTYGRGEGLEKHNGENAYAKFETYREQVDGKYWFPTYTIANSNLNFKDFTQRIKETVKYEDYKQFKSDVNIKYGDVDESATKPPTPPTPPKKP